MAIGGGTPLHEALLEQKRQVIRNALKHEYINKRYSPKAMDQGGVVFDAAIQRWTALQFTYGDHWVPSIRNFSKMMMCSFIPIGLFYYAWNGPHQKRWRKQVAEGEIAFDHPTRREGWQLWC